MECGWPSAGFDVVRDAQRARGVVLAVRRFCAPKQTIPSGCGRAQAGRSKHGFFSRYSVYIHMHRLSAISKHDSLGL